MSCIERLRKLLHIGRSKSTTAIPDGSVASNSSKKKKKKRAKSVSNLEVQIEEPLNQDITQRSVTNVTKTSIKNVSIVDQNKNYYLSTSSDDCDDNIDGAKSRVSVHQDETTMKDNEIMSEQENIIYVQSVDSPKRDDSNEETLSGMKKEINSLRSIIRRLNIELSSYQGTPTSKSTVIPQDGPIPTWIINSKLLSPLISAYEERLEQRDRKIKNIKTKLSDFNQKIQELINENIELHERMHQKIPFQQNGSKLNEWEEIRRQAQLVLEENQLLKEYLDLNRHKKAEIDKMFAKDREQIRQLEANKIELLNYIDKLKDNYNELEKKFTENYENTRKNVPWDDYMKKCQDYKDKIEGLVKSHQSEIDKIMAGLEQSNIEKSQISLKLKNSLNENKRVLAENEVLEKTMRKLEKKLKIAEKKCQLAEIKEKVAYHYLSKCTKNIQKIKIEKQTYENLIKTQEEEQKLINTKVIEENIKVAKLEEKLQMVKDKALAKLNESAKQIRKKENEFLLSKFENEKKFQDMLFALQKKEGEIEDFIKSKKELEDEIEIVWKSTINADQILQEHSMTSFYSNEF